MLDHIRHTQNMNYRLTKALLTRICMSTKCICNTDNDKCDLVVNNYFLVKEIIKFFTYEDCESSGALEYMFETCDE